MQLDFSKDVHYFWALLPEVVLCAWGIVILLAGVMGKRDERVHGEQRVAQESSHDLGWLSLIGIGIAAVVNGWLYGGVHEVGNTSMIAVDGFRLFANWIFLIAAAMGILVSFSYVDRQRLQAGEFYALTLLATAGMMFMGAARDLMVIFLGLEVMSISVYALSAFNRRDRRSAEAGLKYFLLGAFSTGFFLYGIALVYGATGSTNVTLIAQAAGAIASSGHPNVFLLTAGIAMLAIGFGFKVAAVPFHMWTPDVYEGAPSPVTAFMSGGVKAAAFAAFLRVFITGFGVMHFRWFGVLWGLAAITMISANLIAMVQTNIKRMLAYSSIAHAGYLLVALTAGNLVAASGILFYLLVYTIMNIGAFAVVIAVGRQGEENGNIEDYAGLGSRQPMLAVLLTLFLLSLAGFPGTAGFIGKIYLLRGALTADLWTLAVILVLTTVVSYYYYLRLAWYAWMKEPTSPTQHERLYVGLPMRIALVAGALIVLYLGIFPSSVLNVARDSVAGLGGVETPSVLVGSTE
jgi:NADH-quinone oxidoreductase subunit N